MNSDNEQNWLVGVQQDHETKLLNFKIIQQPMSASVYEEFEQIVQVLPDLRATVVDFLACVQSFEELTKLEALLQSQIAEVYNPFLFSETLIRAHALVQLRLDSFLTMVSGFRDRLVRRAGHLGSSSENAKDIFRDIYDDSPEYAMLYYFRNFSQHFQSIIRSIPIDAINMASDLPVVDVKLQVDRDQLIDLCLELKADHAIRKKLVPILREFEEQIPLIEICRKGLNDLQNALIYAVNLKATELDTYEDYMELVKKTVGPDCVPVIFHGPKLDVSKLSQNVELPFRCTTFSLDEFAFLKSILNRRY